MRFEVARAVGVGSLVWLFAERFTIGVVVVVSEEEDTWFEWRLDSTSCERWVSVEEDANGVAKLAAWHRSIGRVSQPFPAALTHRGESLTLIEYGFACFNSYGTSSIPGSGKLKYALYNTNDLLLAFEQFEPDGPWWVGEGKPLPSTAVTFGSTQHTSP